MGHANTRILKGTGEVLQILIPTPRFTLMRRNYVENQWCTNDDIDISLHKQCTTDGVNFEFHRCPMTKYCFVKLIILHVGISFSSRTTPFPLLLYCIIHFSVLASIILKCIDFIKFRCKTQVYKTPKSCTAGTYVYRQCIMSAFPSGAYQINKTRLV